jgi:hypothetical protein
MCNIILVVVYMGNVAVGMKILLELLIWLTLLLFSINICIVL